MQNKLLSTALTFYLMCISLTNQDDRKAVMAALVRMGERAPIALEVANECGYPLDCRDKVSSTCVRDKETSMCIVIYRLCLSLYIIIR